jgi:pyruvate-ferredoxin/flavodoxin oxidoreductase
VAVAAEPVGARASSAVTAALDANEAVARVAYRLSEVIAIYPITPASPMGEAADAWAAAGRRNLWGVVPDVVEMQSETGAAGALHGATTRGALATTFTASQGLLLMLPNLYKIAGELAPAVVHVAARTVATHALSIFGDHSDVMAARQTGMAMLASTCAQDAADMALVAHAASLESRVPFLHFFDGFRTSHEITDVAVPSDDDLRAIVSGARVAEHRRRGLDPGRPELRGSAQNPDVFFQAREASNPYYDAVPGIVTATFGAIAARTGRQYTLVEYHGAPDAERVVVVMGSAVHTFRQTVDALVARGERVGVVNVRLYRPFPGDALLAALAPTVRTIGVLDRTKEPGAPGEPLYLDVAATVLAGAAAGCRSLPRVAGGRFGLSSKELTPAMAKGVFDHLAGLDQAPAATGAPAHGFTVGIVDDVTRRSIPWDPGFDTDHARLRAVFYGLGSDGTVGATKESAKIVGAHTDLHVQAYFVYDSKKSGSTTVSHLRVDDAPIRSPYLVARANFVACHRFGLLERLDVLALAEPGATVLLDSPYGPDGTWDRLPREVQQQILDLRLNVHVVDAYGVASTAGLKQINTVMQACFFALTDVMDIDAALEAMESALEHAYGRRGAAIVDANRTAIRAALPALAALAIPAGGAVTATHGRRPVVPAGAPDFVQRVTARMLAGEGDLLPVSALPVDGSFPTGTARFEKRQLADEIPLWDPDICIDCARCALVCPHAAIRMKVYDPAALGGAPGGFLSRAFRSREHPGLALTIQVAPDDCTGCGVCVDVCPAKSKEQVKHKALDMAPFSEHVDTERARFEHFLTLPHTGALDPATVKGSQTREPLFEFSGACSGCGETPYLKLLSQLFGDRAIVANATGCSSIYGGNLPTTPWTTNAEGRGPAWSNSLFEDNAEFGLGIRAALDRQAAMARDLVAALGSAIGDDLAGAILAVDPSEPAGDAAIAAQRSRVAELDRRLALLAEDADPCVRELATRLAPITSALARTSVWIVGGDGWAYDIGSGGLEHVLASGYDVNVLVLDTEVYSNTGGQASKATPRGAVAKFAAAGKATPKRDLGAVARAYGHVYVAQIALGANDVQAVKAFAEAEAWSGPSLVLAYSTCIAHGIDMRTSMSHQKVAVQSGHWPLYRYQPATDGGTHPFRLDSKAPTVPLAELAAAEGRYAMLARSDPERAHRLLEAAQRDVDERWRWYSQLAGLERSAPDIDGVAAPHAPDAPAPCDGEDGKGGEEGREGAP